jgi:hypothetical protein
MNDSELIASHILDVGRKTDLESLRVGFDRGVRVSMLRLVTKDMFVVDDHFVQPNVDADMRSLQNKLHGLVTVAISAIDRDQFPNLEKIDCTDHDCKDQVKSTISGLMETVDLRIGFPGRRNPQKTSLEECVTWMQRSVREDMVDYSESSVLVVVGTIGVINELESKSRKETPLTELIQSCGFPFQAQNSRMPRLLMIDPMAFGTLKGYMTELSGTGVVERQYVEL